MESHSEWKPFRIKQPLTKISTGAAKNQPFKQPPTRVLGLPGLFKQPLPRVLGVPGLSKQPLPRVLGLPGLFKQPLPRVLGLWVTIFALNNPFRRYLIRKTGFARRHPDSSGMVQNGTKTDHLERLGGLGPEMVQNGTQTNHLERLGGLGPEMVRNGTKTGHLECLCGLGPEMV